MKKPIAMVGFEGNDTAAVRIAGIRKANAEATARVRELQLQTQSLHAMLEEKKEELEKMRARVKECEVQYEQFIRNL